MTESFVKGFVKAAVAAGLSDDQICEMVVKQSMAPGMMAQAGMMQQQPMMSGQGGMMPGHGMPQQGMMPQQGAPPPADFQIPQANQGQMQPGGLPMPPKQLMPVPGAIQPRF